MLNSKLLEVTDAILLPARPMAPGANGASRKSAKKKSSGQDPYANRFTDVATNDAGGRQAVARATDPATGPNCHHYTLGAGLMLELRRGGTNQVLHRENAIYQPYTSYLPPLREFIVSVNWAGTDFTLENGATRVVPGSHEWPEDRIAKEDEIAQAVMPKGSALLWISRTLHGAATNETDGPRTAFFGSYVVDWVRQEENQYLSVPLEVAEKMSPRAQQIIGYRSSRTLGWVKGRDQDHLLLEGKSSPL